MNDDELYVQELEPIALREELLTEYTAPTLSVMVDFNDLYADHGDEAFGLIGKLKDLLA